jgi:hypothetical protein
MSAFTRVFDALWRAAWGLFVTNQKKTHPDRIRCAQAVDPPHKGEGCCGTAALSE